MKILYSWLKDFIPLELPARELAEHLFRLGFEVDELVETGAAFDGVVVGEVLKVEKHPNADRLSVCEVTDGEETFPVVCGAPNVAAGQRVPFARVGAKLPGGHKIKKSKIRGAESRGMICSTVELGMPDDGTRGSGIHVIPGESRLGEDFGRRLGDSDAVFDIPVTANRPDCLSHYGLARELAVYFDLPLKAPAVEAFDEKGPASEPVKVLEESECPRYMGRVVEDVRVGPSPDWLVKRLEAVGLRPINNVVDITNYVLLETGQPFHAFDLDKLDGGKVHVRSAGDGEKILALDGKEYELSPENLVIADARRPVAVAGVIGGELSGVTESTRRVFLEIACFRPGRVRRSARRLGVSTDSSYRFERGTDRGGMREAGARAVSLFLSLAGGRAGPGTDTSPDTPERPPIEVSADRVNRALGTEFAPEKVEGVLRRLSRRLEGSDGRLTVHPPSYRGDLESAWDLVEEVARHLGYAAVPTEAAPVRLRPAETLAIVARSESARDALRGLGFYEAYNYDFLSAADIERFQGAPASAKIARLENPVSEDWVYLRPTLLAGLLRNAVLNERRGAGALRLFEIGKTYVRRGDRDVSEGTRLAGLLAGPLPAHAHWRDRGREPDFFAAKGVIDSLLADLPGGWRAPENPDPAFHPKASMEVLLGGKPLGRAGLAHPDLLRRWDLGLPGVVLFELDLDLLSSRSAERARFREYSTFPSASRDLSVLVRSDTSFDRVESCVAGLGLPELVRTDLVDVFEQGKSLPAGKKSLTVRLTFSRKDRTLRDEEVQKAVDRVLQALGKTCGAELRS